MRHEKHYQVLREDIKALVELKIALFASLPIGL